ncbi:MAG: hypothetical protein ACFE9N_00890 [Promethearchaeota archaeon]
MSNEKERNGENARENEKIRWELNEIRDELLDELDELHDDFYDEIEDLIEDSYDVKEDLQDELDELEQMKVSLFDEIGDVKKGLDDLGEGAKEKIESAREKLERLKEKAYKQEEKFREKLERKLEKAKKKAVKRINISVDPEMSEEWKDWAEGLGASVSELVRKSMKFVKNNIGDIAKLEVWGRKMEQAGKDLEKNIQKAVKESKIEDLGDMIERKIEKKVKKWGVDGTEKERVKKRVQGLIKLQNSIPIDKFSQALSISEEEAENIIYELAAEGIEGSLEEGVFKFSSPSEEVISKIYELIDKM